MIVAVIPARGGSKRLADKNLQLLGGRPLVAWSIQSALRAAAVDLCFVSTDSPAIAAAAREAEVLDRPEALSGDLTPTVDVLAHAIAALDAEGRAPDLVVTLQPTSPFRPEGFIDAAVARLEDGVSAVMSVSPVSAKFGRIVDGLFRPSYAPGTRGQDLEPLFREDGVVYVSRAEAIRAANDMFGAAVAAFVTPRPWGLVDIDDAQDLALAEALAAVLSLVVFSK